MRVLPALLLLGLLPAGVSAAAAQPRSIGDCEKVKGDLAYNQCLASFGPPARAGAARSQGGETDAGDQAAEPEPQRNGSSRVKPLYSRTTIRWETQDRPRSSSSTTSRFRALSKF